MHWLALGLLGGIVALDATAFPQIMLSRPLVAATLAGWLGGQPVAGLAIGVVLEVFDLVVVPFGASRNPESGPAAVAAAGAAVAAAGPGAEAPEVLLFAVVYALLLEHLSGSSVLALRRADERLVASMLDGPLDPDALERRHLAAMTLDFVRGALIAVLGMALGTLLMVALPRWGLGPVSTAEMLRLATIVMAAAALGVFGGWVERRASFLAGVLAGVLLLVMA